MVPQPPPEPGALSASPAAIPWSPSEEAQPVVELRGVSRTYGSDPPVEALRSVDLIIPRGDFVAIIGPSGSGKSTLLNILGCLDRPTAGTYRLGGTDVSELNDSQRTAVRGRSIGFVFQSFHLLGHRTALENVMLAEVYGSGERNGRRERAMAALERVGMEERSDFLPTKLSGGQQQRVAIARALLGSPEMLLCDEPTGNLDSATTESLLLLFEALGRQGLTFVVVTHDDDVAARAKRIIRIVDGHLSEVSK
jgi:ABC-type lipoprotein export system ATPase subunit